MSSLHCPHCHAPLSFSVEQCPSCRRRLPNNVSTPHPVTPQTPSPFGTLPPEREDLRTPYQGTPVPPTLLPSGPPSHTLEAPALPGELEAPALHGEEFVFDTSSDSGFVAASTHEDMDQFALPTEDEFPTTIASSEELLGLIMDSSPETVENLSAKIGSGGSGSGEQTLLHQPALGHEQDSPRPTLKQPVPKAWSTPVPLTSMEKAAAQAAQQEPRVPASEEALLPVEEDEATMLGHIDLLGAEFLTTPLEPKDATRPLSVGEWDDFEKKMAADLLLDDVAMVEVIRETPSRPRPSFTAVSEEAVQAAEVEAALSAPPTQQTPMLGPASEARPLTGEDTYDHLLNSLGVGSSPNHTLEGKAVPVEPLAKGGHHTLEHESLPEEPAASSPPKVETSLPHVSDSFGPPKEPISDNVRVRPSDNSSARRAVALRMKSTSDEIEGSQAELIAAPAASSRLIGVSDSPGSLDHRKRRALRDSNARGQGLKQWLIWGGAGLLLLAGASVAFLYSKYATPKAPSVQLAPGLSDPFNKESH